MQIRQSLSTIPDNSFFVKMTLPRRLNYNPSSRRSVKPRHRQRKVAHQLPSVVHPVAALSSSQDAIQLCSANQRLIDLDFKKEGKRIDIDQITSQMLLMLSKDTTVQQPSVLEQLNEVKMQEKKIDNQISALRTSHKNVLCKHKSFDIFDTSLCQIELSKQSAIKTLLYESNSSTKKQRDELTAVTNLKHAKQRLHLKNMYLSLCQSYVRRLDGNALSYSNGKGKGVVIKREVLSMAASDQRMKRWNTKRFQKRKNLPQHSRRILKDWIDEHIDAPHPTDGEKKALAEAAKITIEQVSNWFVNARVRYVPKRLKALECLHRA